MAGLQELRFPEEKPLLRSQDAAELVSRPVACLAVLAPPGGKAESRTYLQQGRVAPVRGASIWVQPFGEVPPGPA